MTTRPRLILVSPDSCAGPEVQRLADLLPRVAADVDALILRWKYGSVRERFEAARWLGGVPDRPPLILSDRPDVARAASLDGVQLTEGGFAPADVRAFWREAVIGTSRHDHAGIHERSGGADWALLGPVHPTATKPGEAGLGDQGFAAIARSAPVAVIALGGIDATRVASLIRAGASGVAVRSTVFDAPDPVDRVRDLRRALDSAFAPAPDDELVARPDRRTRPE